jgi:hypothetical protein
MLYAIFVSESTLTSYSWTNLKSERLEIRFVSSIKAVIWAIGPELNQHPWGRAKVLKAKRHLRLTKLVLKN